MTSRTWTDGSGLPLSAAQLNSMETDIQKGIDALAGLSGKEPTVTAGTSAQYYRGDKTMQTLNAAAVGLGSVNNTADSAKPVSTAQAAAIATAIDGVPKADAGGTYRIIACTLRNTGSGFAILNDASHEPIGVTSVSTAGDDLSLTLTYSFTATQVGSLICVPDDTLAAYGYTFGASVGLTTAVITAAQPGGFGDYLNWNGSAWVSLNGYITSASMNGTTGEVTANHATLTGPVGGSVTSRSDTKRASMEGLGASTTNFKLMDTSGVSVKTPTTDNRVWITRSGARAVKMTELVQSNSNIWVFGIMRTN